MYKDTLVGWSRWKTLEIDLIQTFKIEVNRAEKMLRTVSNCHTFNQITITSNGSGDITGLVRANFPLSMLKKCYFCTE